MGKQFVNTDQNGWTWITRNKKSKPIGNPYHKDLENIATSFYVTNMPPALTSKGLWNVCASHGRLVDAFIANKLSKGGKRFGFIKFLGVKDANSIVNSMSNIWIGSFHLYITLALNQRLNTKTLGPKYTQSQPKPTNAFTTTNNQKAFPTLNNIATNNTPPEIKTHQPKPSYSSNLKYVPILLVKLKDIDSMENMYVICRNEENESLKRLYSVKRAPMPNFKVDERILWIEVSGLPLCAWGSMAYKKIASSFGKFLFFEKEESTALSSGRLCISTKSHQFISEIVHVDIKNEYFEVSVQEIGSWSTKIKDDYNDISSNHDLKEVDHVSESIDEQPIDAFETLQTKLNNMDEQAFDNELGTEGDKKDGENRYSIDSPKKKVEEATNFNSTNSETKDNSSDLSRPPGFEFMKKSFSSSSNCSTSFARHRKNDIKGFSLLSELNQIIEVGSSLGYDVRGCTKLSKLDRFLISEDVTVRLLDVRITALDRRNQMINGIMVKGNWITNPCLIKDAFLQFYKRKFQAQDTQEIKEAVWDCGSSKAPGPDGYSFAFVKKYWGTIQKDLYDFVNLFFATCVMPNGANSGLIFEL
ncbi:RNA-directed DNA polymerase, eukaryota [Tanacetum coccineum]|uniref:RNA-directed DNA polymerase, eukaryota n=1 Tax=Tanacetum coccineum TaxID=301880 RepID=A0ABQ5CLJ9_9ASTR